MKNSRKDLDEWCNGLRKSDKLIIVEGKKDKKALEYLGIDNIITLKRPLYQAVEEAASRSREVIILTDFDKKGKELYGRLSKDLKKQGVKVDNFFREHLQKNTKLSHIEGINTYIKHLQK